MSDYIDFGNGHTTVVGMTQSGKTTAVLRSLERVKGAGVIFFNTQHIPFPNSFVDATGADDTDVLIKALRKGEKINFMPNRETRWKQLVFLVKRLYEATEKSKLDIYIVIDEIHLSDKEALKSAIEIATTGITWGLKGVFISQRPALIDNTLMTQSMQFIFLFTTLENKYLKGYGIPADDISAGLDRGGQYAYMVYNFHELRGPFKV